MKGNKNPKVDGTSNFLDCYESNWKIWQKNKLYNDYQSKLFCYLSSLGVSALPLPLLEPHLYFYLETPQSSKSKIRTVDFFTYGNNQRTNKLSLKTFPYFLKNVCNLSSNNPYVSNLFQSLHRLLVESPRNDFDIAFENLKSFAPQFAAWVVTRQAIFIDKEKNLYLDATSFSNSINIVYELPRYQSILSLSPELFSKADSTKHFFTLLEKEVTKSHDLSALFTIENGLFFRNALSRNQKFFSAHYNPETDTFSVQEYPSYNDTYSLKAIPVDQGTPLENVPESVELLFNHLCKSNIGILNQLALFFSTAMSPNNATGFTVLYTKQHKQLLTDILTQIFSDTTVRISPDSLFTTFNQIANEQNIKKLFIGQSEGKGIVFVKDKPTAAASKISGLRKLFKGKAINISTNLFPNQHYFNNLHFICITDDDAKLKLLKSSIQLINFTRYESPFDTPISLTKEDIHWLRTTFILYGLKLQTIQLQKVIDPNPFDAQSTLPLTEQEELQLFVDKYCHIEKNTHCRPSLLYHAYIQFYRTLYNGKEPTLTEIKFNKQFRKYAEINYGNKISKNKKRYIPGQDPFWAYQGIHILETPFPLPTQKNIDLLSEYLEHINSYRIAFDFPPVVRASIGKK